jgi:SWI/SNF-related matrix-associated actin-dependent regulator 1 of chromatin subfamily A
VRLDGLFNIVSYDLVTKLSQAIGEASFKIIIADESHYLKNGLAKRTNACVPLLQKAKYAILLTGTPALSRPIELFKQLEALQPVTYKSLHEYGNRYCIGGNFGVYQGSSNLQELHGLVKATVMIRRLKRDVLSQLPQKRRQQVFIALDDKGIKQMRALFHELESIRRAIKATSEDEFERLKYSEKQLVNKIYTDSAVAKLPAVQDYLTTLLEADCKFLIFAHHQTMLDGIEEVLMKKKVGHIRIDGGTPQSARQALVTRFQETDSVRAAVVCGCLSLCPIDYNSFICGKWCLIFQH